MTYFATRNINHNGSAYVAGDVVDIDESAAAPLLVDGALSTDEPEDVTPEVVETVETEQEPELPAGGGDDRELSGEPTFDAAATGERAENAPTPGTELGPDEKDQNPEDVTPEVDPSANL